MNQSSVLQVLRGVKIWGLVVMGLVLFLGLGHPFRAVSWAQAGVRSADPVIAQAQRQWGFIDYRGRLVIPAQFEDAYSFTNDNAPACGRPAEPGDKFCAGCGTALPAASNRMAVARS